MQRLETKHGPGNSFDETVVLFNDIVEILGLDNLDSLSRTGELEDYA